ncbi:conserved hypothetical protein [Candidatus Sulfobium mesophilum]|uniref:DUF4265 domain-containing protein n=1 Tax=Candidatus Sulfobium mesophilum TaxID=2016548 RepID=A0A2U3QF08_9BACT|nr:conserved hypothetical protein [Candidatus Sulfobium mesophilum]
MSDCKILLTYLDSEGNCRMESVWATSVGAYYKIDNIPFFAPNIALGDLVSVEEDEGELHFDRLIEPSGHSTIQMIFFNESDVVRIAKVLEGFGCTWEGSHIRSLISVNVPKEVNYISVRNYLEIGEKEGRWSYKEACLAHKQK